MTQSNAELIRSGYEAFGRADVPAVLAVFSADIKWHIPGRNPISGDYTGHEEVVGFFQKLLERSNGTFNIDVHAVLEDGEHTVVVVVTEHGERNGASLSAVGFHLWRLEDGKAVSFQAFNEDNYKTDEFWA